jgi:dTDP-4-dehydrorhamnose 3,5-epimerase
MKFVETPLAGAFVIEPEPRVDDRGFFARVFCRDEFQAQGLELSVAQSNVSFNEHGATLRGLHYQIRPHGEAKLVRCTMGAIFDAIVDLRPDSLTLRHWYGVELNANNHRMLYVPVGFAHGYLTLIDRTEVFYQVSEFYNAEFERGMRWDDPAFGIQWPLPPELISDKDRAHPLFER